MKKEIDFKAVALGVLADCLGTPLMLFGQISMMALYFVWSQDLIWNAAMGRVFEIADSAWFLGLEMLLGTLGSILGGYVGGRVAQKRQIFHGFIVGCVGLILGLGIELFKKSPFEPLGYSLLGILITLPASVLGGSLAIRSTLTE